MITQEAIDEIQNLGDEIAERARQIKDILRKADPTIYDRARRTWLSDITLAINDENPEGFLVKPEHTLEDTVDDMLDALQDAASGHTEPEENCEGCRGK